MMRAIRACMVAAALTLGMGAAAAYAGHPTPSESGYSCQGTTLVYTPGVTSHIDPDHEILVNGVPQYQLEVSDASGAVVKVVTITTDPQNFDLPSVVVPAGHSVLTYSAQYYERHGAIDITSGGPHPLSYQVNFDNRKCAVDETTTTAEATTTLADTTTTVADTTSTTAVEETTTTEGQNESTTTVAETTTTAGQNDTTTTAPEQNPTTTTIPAKLNVGITADSRSVCVKGNRTQYTAIVRTRMDPRVNVLNYEVRVFTADGTMVARLQPSSRLQSFDGQTVLAEVGAPPKSYSFTAQWFTRTGTSVGPVFTLNYTVAERQACKPKPPVTTTTVPQNPTTTTQVTTITELPHTGSGDAGGLAALGATLLGGGAVALTVAERKRRTA